jgi:DNA-binding MarR family transcriptional regulator
MGQRDLPAAEHTVTHITYVRYGPQADVAHESALDRQLTYRLHRVKKITDGQSARSYQTECGIPLSEGRCLAAIGSFEPLSVNDLAYRANLTKGQASRAAQALVERNLVRKEPSETDARSVVLKLTEAGRPVFERAMAMIVRRNGEIFGCLTPAEQGLLGELLDRIASYSPPPDEESADDV